ncbi:hypothetical protein HPG69_010668 [Diceros bicornis minor]|uniref:Ig-like domain-containing protein n=1 Tax=Diceros bicornis minor TaxID=77932 RepID=A0A7J7EXE9_DICBM|nr:hypothetical protein HPG69_010668 [Diceros bicornis minor]
MEIPSFLPMPAAERIWADCTLCRPLGHMLLWTALLFLANLPKAVVSLEPPWINVLREDTVTLKCQGAHAPGNDYTQWFHNGSSITTQVQPSYSFKARNNDSGDYRCQTGQTSLSDPVHLDVISGQWRKWHCCGSPVGLSTSSCSSSCSAMPSCIAGCCPAGHNRCQSAAQLPKTPALPSSRLPPPRRQSVWPPHRPPSSSAMPRVWHYHFDPPTLCYWGPPPTHPFNQSQAQMYLRPQLGNLLQVNWTLGRNVPLASQIILMPVGAVAAVEQEVPSAQSPEVHADADQVQNLAVRNQQAPVQGSTQKTILLSLASSVSSQALAEAQASSGASGQSSTLTLAVKHKVESEERDNVSALGSMLPSKAYPAAKSPKAVEEKSSLGEKDELVTSGKANTPSSERQQSPPPISIIAYISHGVQTDGRHKTPTGHCFGVQEGAEPFLVGCSSLLKESEKPLQAGLLIGLNESQSDKKANLLNCEHCGKYAPAEQFCGSKRFCSMSCTKRYNLPVLAEEEKYESFKKPAELMFTRVDTTAAPLTSPMPRSGASTARVKRILAGVQRIPVMMKHFLQHLLGLYQ